MLQPRIVQIETVTTACTARCIMCPIESWTRTPGIMPLDLFALIVDRMAPHAASIEHTALQGCGEPLLDRTIADKVALARRHGLRGIHLATNATELSERTARALLDAGIHRVIVSIDGATKRTHEAIRRRTAFEAVVANTQRLVALRDAGGHDAAVWVRMIRQPLNAAEWDDYRAFWTRQLDPARGDRVIGFPAHNWGGNAAVAAGPVAGPPVTWCEDLWQRIYIHGDGAIALCCVDDDGWYEIGNVRDVDPIEALNTSPVFQRHRALMAAGRIGELAHCRTCTVPAARALAGYRDEGAGR